jgi:MFS family permease
LPGNNDYNRKYGHDNNDKDDIVTPKPTDNSRIPLSAWKILVILSCISIIVLYGETMLVPAIPHIIDDFNITYSTSSWILSSYLIAGAISVPVAGKLSDIYGRKKILLLVLTIYTVGVVGAAFSVDIYSLLISRTIQGIGMSVFPIVFAIVQDKFPRKKIAIAQGTLASMFAFGGVLGLVIGGNIIEYFGWKATFYSIMPVALLLIIIIIKHVDVKEPPQGSQVLIQEQQEKSLYENDKVDSNSRGKEKKLTKSTKRGERGVITRLDIKGVIFLAIAITSFLSALTLVQSSTAENVSSSSSHNVSQTYQQIVFFTFLGSTSLGIFIFLEKKSSSPIIDFKLISKKTILISNILVIIWGICTFAIFQTIPILVQSPVQAGGLGGNAVNAANIQLPFSITSLIFGPTSGFIISKVGSPRVIFIGALVMTCGFFAILVLNTDIIYLVTTLAVIGVGLSLLNVGQLNLNAISVSPRLIGTSLGINTLLRYIGSAIGPAVAGVLMQTNQTVINITGNEILKTFPSSQSYNFIFTVTLILSIIAIMLSMKMLYIDKEVKRVK